MLPLEGGESNSFAFSSGTPTQLLPLIIAQGGKGEECKKIGGLIVSPRVLWREESPERAEYRSFSCLAVAQRGKQVTAQGDTATNDRLTAAIFCVPAKDYQDQNATVRQASGSQRAARVQGDPTPRQPRAPVSHHWPSSGNGPAPRFLRAQHGPAGSGSGAEGMLGPYASSAFRLDRTGRRRKLTVLPKKCVLPFLAVAMGAYGQSL